MYLIDLFHPYEKTPTPLLVLSFLNFNWLCCQVLDQLLIGSKYSIHLTVLNEDRSYWLRLTYSYNAYDRLAEAYETLGDFEKSD